VANCIRKILFDFIHRLTPENDARAFELAISLSMEGGSSPLNPLNYLGSCGCSAAPIWQTS